MIFCQTPKPGQTWELILRSHCKDKNKKNNKWRMRANPPDHWQCGSRMTFILWIFYRQFYNLNLEVSNPMVIQFNTDQSRINIKSIK